jgi:ribosome-associated heat shock protein Hsp15
MGGAEADGGQRIDKWLWHGRFVKTRTLASRLVMSGMVRVNRERVLKPSHLVRAGDVITAALHGRVRVVKILAISGRRGAPAEAQALYEDVLTLDRKDPDSSFSS